MADDDDQLRKKKQLFLIENVAEDGFDTSKFNNFLAEKCGPSYNLDGCSFEELYDLVQDFKTTRLGASTRSGHTVHFNNNLMQSAQSMEAGINARYTTGQAGLDVNDTFDFRGADGPRPTLDGFDLADDFNPYARTLLKDCP